MRLLRELLRRKLRTTLTIIGITIGDSSSDGATTARLWKISADMVRVAVDAKH